MRRQILIWVGIFAVLTGLCDAKSGSFKETFSDYSGLDADKTSADWSKSNSNVSLHEIRTLTDIEPLSICPDSEDGFFLLATENNIGEMTLILHHFDANGLPKWNPPGRIIAKNHSGFYGDLSLVSAGLFYVTYVNLDEDSKLLTQLYNSKGNPKWPNATQVNTGSFGASVTEVQTAKLPNDELVIAFLDNRNEEFQVFAQRIDSQGSIYWDGDVQIQPSHAGAEYSPLIDADDSGNIFVGWGQQNETKDFLYSRIKMNGAVIYETGQAVPLDTSWDQTSFSMCILPEKRVYFSWLELDKYEYEMESICRNYNGTTDYSSDLAQLQVMDPFESVKVTLQGNGDLLICCKLKYLPEQYYFKTLCLLPEEAETLESEYIEYNNVDMLLSFQLCPGTKEGTFYTWANRIGRSVTLKIEHLKNNGSHLWDNPKEIHPGSGGFHMFSSSLTQHSVSEKGFSLSWIDERFHAPHCYACFFNNPDQTNIVPHKLDLSSGKVTNCRSAESLDGTHVAGWIEYNGSNKYLSIGWYDSAWTKIWTKPEAVAYWINDPSTPKWNLAMNKSGQCVVALCDAHGVYLQIINKSKSNEFPEWIHVNNPNDTGSYECVFMLPLDDGSVLVSWVENLSEKHYIRVQKITPDGTKAWTDPLLITETSPNSILKPILVRLENINHILFSAEYGNNAIYDATFGDDGSLISTPTKISEDYDEIIDMSVAVQNNDLFVVWIDFSDGWHNVMSQKIVDSMAVWTDRKITTQGYETMESVDMMSKSPDTLWVIMSASKDGNLSVLAQEMNRAGDLTYPNERNLIPEKPKYYPQEICVSSRVSRLNKFAWALLCPSTELNGGGVTYKMSNDCGQTWFKVEPDLPFVFPSTGMDLRWKAVLFSDQLQNHTPCLNEISIFWDLTQLGLDLDLSKRTFQAGDLFNLSLVSSNIGAPAEVDQYLILDVMGEYWFWPGWEKSPDFQQITIPSGYKENVLFNFQWPEGTGAAEDIRFWAAFLEPGTANLVGPYDMVEFDFR